MIWVQRSERVWICGDFSILMENCPRLGGIYYVLFHNGNADIFKTLEAAQNHVK